MYSVTENIYNDEVFSTESKSFQGPTKNGNLNLVKNYDLREMKNP